MIRVIIVRKRELDLVHTTSLLNSQINVSVIGTGSDSYQAIRLAEIEQPDIAIIDYQLDRTNSAEFIPLIKRKCPGTGIIVFSPFSDEKHVREAMIRGVSGYLVQRSDLDLLAGIIQMVHTGGCYISRRIIARNSHVAPEEHRKPSRAASHSPGYALLSRTEQRIIGYINQGRTTKEIAETLSLRMGTVRNYISVLMRKTGIHSRWQMADFILTASFGRLEFPLPLPKDS
jgi:two-component system response regulator DesR